METLRYVLLTNGLLAVVTIAFYVLLRRETFFGANRLALWLGLTASLVLPLLRIPDWRPQPVRAVMQRTAQVIVPRVLPSRPATQPEVTITFPNGRTYPVSGIRQANGFTWSWQTGLVALYVAGVVLLLIRLGLQLMTLRRLIGQSEHEEYDDFTLVRTKRVESPFSFFGWVVLNPAAHAPDELEQILRHERVHVRARHSLDMLGAELVRILFWFNPAAYLFRHLLHQTLEFAADRAVLAEGVDARAYQYNLLKVSLSAGQSTITNHFSQSQLKSRIVMLNQPESARTTWLRYPVLGLAALIAVTGFARPNDQTLKKFVPAPVAETVAAVISPTETMPEPVVVAGTPIQTDTVRQARVPVNDPETDVTPAVDSIRNVAGPDSARTSPSRYMVYKGDYLYWVITPKMTFDDFMVLKQEFAKHGHQMQLNAIKYDPFYVYIDQIAFSVVQKNGGSTFVHDSADDDNYKPISSAAGYFSTSKSNGTRGTGNVKEYGYELPEPLRKVAVDDEAAVEQLVKGRRTEYKLMTGYEKFAKPGSGTTTYKKDSSGKTIHENSGLTVRPDGTLSVREEFANVSSFINNEPVTREAIGRWSIRQLYAVVKITQFSSDKGEDVTSALLIYVNEDN